TPKLPVETPFTPVPLVDEPLTPVPFVDEPPTPVPRVDVPRTPKSKTPLELPSCPVSPATPLASVVLLNAVRPTAPGPPAEVDLRPAPEPAFASVTHGDELVQLVNGPTADPARELAVLPTNSAVAVSAAATVPSRLTSNI